MKSIILVGANGSGKTTLAKELSNLFSLEYVHAGPSPGNMIKAVECCAQQLIHLDKGCIMDRITPICRRVYETHLRQDEANVLAALLRPMVARGVVIYCTGQGKFTNKDYYPEGHYEDIVNSQQRIRNKYEFILRGVPYLTYNWENNEYDTLVERLNEKIQSL